MRDVRVLVTGGSGFIGREVVAALLAAGLEVRVLDLQAGEAKAAAVETLRGDVRDPDVVRRALAGVDAVSHQAAKVGLGEGVADLPDYVGANDLGTAVLLAGMAAAGVRRLVLASSMVVYGEGAYSCPQHGPVVPGPRNPTDLAAGRFEPPCPRCGRDLAPGPVKEDAALDPRNGYAVTKLAQEQLAGVWARETGGRVAALRYHNVYGPGMPRDTRYAGVAALFRAALLRGEAPRVFEDGRQRRDFVHVQDVAAANVAALTAGTVGTAGTAGTAGTVEAPPPLRAYNVASGEARTVGEIAKALAAAYDGPAPVVTGEYRLGDVRHVTASARRAAAELGWTPRVSFADGMRQLAAR